VARRCALLRSKSRRWRSAARAELALYLTHGILHLAGYNDHRPAEFRRMHAREDTLLAEFGLGPVFNSPP
jgi:probable rRNA maturation factor